MFPYYLSIGMRAEDFWHGDPAWAKAYRKAEELRLDRVNREAWWQGMYIYEALCNASPLFRAFGKKGAKATPYPAEPYDIKPKKTGQSKRESEKKQYLKLKRSMEAFAASFNANRTLTKGGEPDGGRNGDRQPANTDPG